jgi:hypothetical protein
MLGPPTVRTTEPQWRGTPTNVADLASAHRALHDFGWIRDPERKPANGLLVEQPRSVNTANPRRHERVTPPSRIPGRSVCGYGLTVRRAKL